MPEPTLFEPARAVNRTQLPGPSNHNWKGGRSVASNGYVLIKVGKDHHLADVRGYAYEHRLNAEKMIGRRLLPGELVHHKNGDKQDNRDENLEVCEGNAEHFLHHRVKSSGLRVPGESNSMVLCACGCGSEFEKFDSAGRPRKYVSGHNPPPAPSKLAILAALESGPRSRREIANEMRTGVRLVAVCLSKLRTQGLVERKGGGVWQLARR